MNNSMNLFNSPADAAPPLKIFRLDMYCPVMAMVRMTTLAA